MAVIPRPFPPALPHGDLAEVLPDIFFVTGTARVSGTPVVFSRNMTVLREGERLILVNTVRLDDRGLAALDRLGKVTDVLRLAGNHGSDDPFYADRYGARVSVLKGQRYTPGFGPSPDTYFTPHAELDASSALPVADGRIHFIGSKPPEGLLVLAKHGGVVVAGDCFQNLAKSDAYFNVIAKIVMPFMGFMKPHNVGPAWLKSCKPPKADLRSILGLSFENVLPAHGAPVLGKARELYRPALERVA